MLIWLCWGSGQWACQGIQPKERGNAMVCIEGQQVTGLARKVQAGPLVPDQALGAGGGC